LPDRAMRLPAATRESPLISRCMAAGSEGLNVNRPSLS
jgi:hypothetical protein